MRVMNAPSTKIPAKALVALRAQGLANSRKSPFVDPYVIARCTAVLDRRGEPWAADVLGRDISRRSIGVPRRPYLIDGEPETLVAADVAETKLAFDELVNR